MSTDVPPFCNGTEGHAWMSRWCAYCVHDHDMHPGQVSGGGCRMIIEAMVRVDGWRWPEAWTREPPGMFGCPSYMLCGMFEPCTAGSCTGDPAPEERAERVAMVQAAWADHRSSDQKKGL